jgi:hypothetical protein
MLNHLENVGFIDLRGSTTSSGWSGYVQLSFDGLVAAEELGGSSRNVDQAFVAMWFSSELNEAYSKGIEPAIVEAGYRPMRIDAKDHNNKIDDEIIAEIRRSRFLIADFTCGVHELKEANEHGKSKSVSVPRGGVYFEAGFARGLGLEVIWTCREDMINHVHFDTRQFNHILWKDPNDLRAKLSKRISATIGDGPLRKPN